MGEIYTTSATLIDNTIYARRKQLGMDRADLARKVRCQESFIADWEHGKAIPQGAFAGRLASVLQINPDQLKAKKALSNVKPATAKVKTGSVLVHHASVSTSAKKPSFPEDLKAHRVANKLSQQQLAELIDMSQITISRYEAGTSLPSRAALSKLNDIFNYKFNTPTREPVIPKYKKEETKVMETPKEKIMAVSDFDKNFFSNCAEFLKSSLKTEHDICKEVGVVDGYLTREPESRSPLTLELGLKIVKAFDIPLDDFLKDSEKEKIKKQIEMYKKKIAELEGKLG